MSVPQLYSWPCWGPETISQAQGFDSALRAAAVAAHIDQEFIIDLQYTLGVGAIVWDNPYLENNAAGIKTPRFPNGSLHYLTGWLATDKYFQCIEKWQTVDPFFRNLYRLIAEIRKLPEFRVACDTPRKIYTTRVMDDHAYLKRGQIPFIDIAFRCWKPNAPANLHQLILYTAYENYTLYVRSQKRSFFDEGILELLRQIRNAINPEPDSTGKWEFLKIILDNMPLLDTPYEVRRHLLVECYKPDTPESGRSEFERNLLKLDSNLRPRVYVGNETSILSTQDREKLLERFRFLDLDQEQPADDEPPEKSATVDDLANSKKDKNHKRAKSNESQPTPDNQPSYLDSYLNEISGKIGSVHLEFAQRSFFSSNPYLSRDKHFDVHHFLANLNVSVHVPLEVLSKEQADEISVLLWVAIQIGGNLESAAAVVINYIPQKGFGIKPDLSGIWRTRSQQQRATPEVDETLFMPISNVEERPLPPHLADTLNNRWRSEFLFLGKIVSAEKSKLLKAVRVLGQNLKLTQVDWTSNLLRTYLVKENDNETKSQLIQANADTQFTSDGAYYSHVTKRSGILVNEAGSPYFFNLEIFGKYLNLYLKQEYTSCPFEAWNLWTDKVLAVLSCSTGARPVTDLFAEIENFSQDFSLLIIDDKEVVTRESKRLVMLPRKVSSFIRLVYIPTLINLAKSFDSNHPIHDAITGLLQRRPNSKIPLFFHLSQRGVERVHFSTIASTIHPGLPANFARHLVSNHLPVNDRELISTQLGHQIEEMYTHGPNSLRKLNTDLCNIAEEFDALLSQLNVELPTPPQQNSFEHPIGINIPNKFGKKARAAMMKANHKELRLKIIATVNDKLSNFEGDSVHAQTLLDQAINELKTIVTSATSESIIKRLCAKYFQNALPSGVTVFYPARKNKKLFDPFSTVFLSSLQARSDTHSGLMKLLKSFDPRSRSDAFVLLALSLIKQNGITDPILLNKLMSRRFNVGKLNGNAFIEIYPGETARTNETCRRHTLQANSVKFFSTLQQFSERRIDEKAVKISQPLHASLTEIFSHHPCVDNVQKLIRHVQDFEYAHQFFTLPGALAGIARGNTEHRSIDLPSLQAAHSLNPTSIRLLQFPATERVNNTVAKGQVIKKAKELMKSVGLPRDHIDDLFPKSEAKTIALKALRGFTESLLIRRGLKRECLASSTKKLYLGRLSEFFKRTDAEHSINTLDHAGLQETVSSYLEDRNASIESVNDDARQIKDYCNELKLHGFPGEIEVPFFDRDFNPSTTLFSDSELKEIERLVNRTLGAEDNCAYYLYRYYGFRRDEALYQNIEKIFRSDDDVVFQIKGDSAFRTKTPGSNRSGFCIDKLPDDFYNYLDTCLHSRQVESQIRLIPSTTHQSTVDLISDKIQRVANRGSIHTLRHNYANALAHQLLNEAVWGGNRRIQTTPICMAITTPQGIRKHTLLAAARLLGHSSPKMLLSTYAHCAFDILDKVYKQQNHGEYKIDLSTLHELDNRSDSDLEKGSECSTTINPVSHQDPKPLAINLIKEKIATLQDVVSLKQSAQFQNFQRYLKILPAPMRLPLGDTSRANYLKFTTVFHQELLSLKVLRKPTLDVISDLALHAKKNLNPIFEAEPKQVRLQKERLIENAYNHNSNFEPLANFNEDKLFAVREYQIERDLTFLFSLLFLSRTTPKNFKFRTNSEATHPVTEFLNKLNFQGEKLSRHDHRKSLGFNLGYGNVWLFTVNSKSFLKNKKNKEITEKSENINSKCNPLGSSKSGSKGAFTPRESGFDNSKFYLYGLTLHLLIMSNDDEY
ncbi:MAG: hypothetical protein C0422_01150 [Alcaligenaceae bacterium]|nr:hypothetical protein [Alcaligenaceae bacterium]